MDSENQASGGLPGRLRWNPTTPVFVLAAAVFNAAVYHVPLFAYAFGHLDMASANGVLTVITLFVLAVWVTSMIFGLVALVSERALKPLLMFAFLGSSVAVYFVQSYGVILDKTMMGNVFNTNFAEAADLFHPKILAYVLVLGVAPCLLLTRVTVKSVPITRRLAFLGIVLAVTVAWAYANAKTWLWIDKNAKRLGGMAMPWSYLINLPRYMADLAKPGEQKLLPPATFGSSGKTVVMLVIGEAARAMNFQLYGYARPTNPVLSKAGVVVLPHAHSCTTYTTASLLCMLSHVDGGSSAWEPLTSYLQRSGIDVIWRTDNWGEPPMKVQTFQRADALRPDCRGEACAYDEILLQGLEQRIRASTRDRVFIVLHLAGSHGPAYNQKYPPRFETFTPACKSVELSQCSAQDLVNAYDNTIVYNDYVVGQAIDLLKHLAPEPAMLMYLSDHGESLGEYGLYLHGTPYSIAPDFQKDIPFLVWMSDAFKQRKNVAPAQLVPDATHSQANVFHSVMGAFDMKSDVYKPDLDIFNGAP